MPANPTGFRFPALLRIRRRRDFTRTYARGARARGKYFTVVAAPNGLPFSRLGLSVGRKVGGAVRRNKIKRVLREAFRRNRHRLPPGLDLVLVAQEAEARYPYAEVAEDLVRLVARAAAGRPAPRRGAPRRGRR